jgi:riboflavin kinase/FMN adenylyltransferase
MGMTIIEAPAELRAKGRKVCVAIGVFDGVHLGHQQVIHQTLADAAGCEALAVVITFDRHPNAVVAPDRAPPLIYSLPQKIRAIEKLGVDVTCVIPFSEAFSRLGGEEFVRGLVRDFGALRSVCVGSDFSFGYKRSGNVNVLRQLGDELGFRVHGLAAVSLDGQVVRSTRIREAIRAGQLDAASQLLGRKYAVSGLVQPGDQVGRKFGFPTANIDVAGLVLPPGGVYTAHALVDGQSWRCVANLGFRPTREPAAPLLLLEAHLLDFRGDLYGRDVELAFETKLRDEQKFASIELLREQIARDIAAARRAFETS